MRPYSSPSGPVSGASCVSTSPNGQSGKVPKGGILVHPLGCPQQEGELFQRQRLPGELAAASAPPQRFYQRHLANRQLLGRDQVDQGRIFRVRLLNPRGRDPVALICGELPPLIPPVRLESFR